MLTNNGKLHIKRYFANFVPAITRSIAYGIGSKAVSASDTKLQFEIGRSDIVLTSLDLVNNKVVYKAVLPEGIDGMLYEFAIFSNSVNTASGAFGSKLITTFDSATEFWANAGVAATYSTANARIGGDSVRHAPAASASMTHSLEQLNIDLSGYSAADVFAFAYNVGNAFTSAIRFRFMTDANNFYDFNLGAQTAGYKIVEVNKGSAVATGAPSWQNITAIQLTTVSTSGGTSQVDYDGVRIEDVDTINPEYVMVSRELLGTPFAKESGRVQEIEFTLNINV